MDVVLDLMIHDLDIILHIVPSEVTEVHAVGMRVITGKTDIANVRMIFENGTVANLTASRISNKSVRKMRIFQRYSYVGLDFQKGEIEIFERLGKEGDYKIKGDLQHQFQQLYQMLGIDKFRIRRML